MKMGKTATTFEAEKILTSSEFGESAHVLALRREAWETFQALSLPSRSNEAWKYSTPEDFLDENTFRLLHEVSPGPCECAVPAPLVESVPLIADLFTDKEPVIAPGALKLPTGVLARNVSQEIRINESFVAEAFRAGDAPDKFDHLTNSLFTDGIVLRFEKAYENPSPIGVYAPVPRHQAKFSKSFVTVESNTTAEVILWIDGGAEKAQLFKWLVAKVQPNAHLFITVIQVLDISSKLLLRFKGEVHQDGSLGVNFINLGGELVRNELTVEVLGRGAQAGLYGLTLADGKQNFDVRTCQSHQSPKGTSRLRFKQVFMGDSFGVFDGIIRVPPTSAGSDAYQENHNLLLSSKARVHSIPRLEINTDDVRCTHGATVKHVLPHEVFYLRSRGLRERVAKHLLVASFLEEMTQKVTVEGIRAYVESYLRHKIERAIE